MKSARNPNLGWLLTVCSSLLFGLNASTTKVLVHAGFTPNFIVGYRSTATAVLALALVLIWKPSLLKITWRELPALIAFGILGISLMQWTYTNAVSRLPVGISLLIEYLASVGVPVLNWLLFRKRAGKAIWLGISLAMSGVLIVSQFWNAVLDPVGLAYAFGAMACVMFYLITSERIQNHRDSYSMLFYTMLASAVFWWVFVRPDVASQPNLAVSLNLSGNLGAVTVPMWVGLAWIGVFGSFVPMLLNYLALSNLGSTGVGLASISEVVFAFIFGWLWLAETISGIQLAGAVLVTSGIVIAQISGTNLFRRKAIKESNE